jgi:hypothetical protein
MNNFWQEGEAQTRNHRSPTLASSCNASSLKVDSKLPDIVNFEPVNHQVMSSVLAGTL